MKKLSTILVLAGLIFSVTAQQRIPVSEELRNRAYKTSFYPPDPGIIGEFPGTTYSTSSLMLDEALIGDSRYDNQSNASIPQKVFLYDDGTIAATWTRSMNEGSFFNDRGTGYNYFDGANWGPWPTARVENVQVHRPVYAPFGPNGELLVSHISKVGLYFAKRENKGTGSWSFQNFANPPGGSYILWVRAVTSGKDRNRIHLLALTLPSTHGGLPYQGLDGALLYSLSLDGGTTWVMQNVILDGMTSFEFTGFGGDTYAFAEPKGDVVAFVFGDPWTGLYLMKSIDGGLTFTRTTIWNHPYPLWQWGTPTNEFYCADGSHSAVIDDDGKVHVAFGINKAMADANSTYWYPWVDGIAYWNEYMPPFSNDLNALSPYGEPNSELVEDENLIGWTQDVNGNGVLDFLDDLGLYWLGLSSMPQLVYADGKLILVYSSVTENYSNGIQNYRHLWLRTATGNIQLPTWHNFEHLTSDLVHVFDECVYPACAPAINNYLHLIYQHDNFPGTATWGAQHPYTDNFIAYLKFDLLSTAIPENRADKTIISPVYPNPFKENAVIKVDLTSSSDILTEIMDVSGRIVYRDVKNGADAGLHLIRLNASDLHDGLLIYRVKAGDQIFTGKMIVQ
ncbi:MAG: T9SS type A sorting domain-containing protein [Bacteroidales bacterium]